MTPLKLPEFLKTGDTVAIAATARKVTENDISHFREMLLEKGYKVILADNIFESYHQFAGDDETRAKALQKLLDNEEIKAIFFARGGYGTVRIIDRIDFTGFTKYPKWLVGFSDLTVLHQHVIKNCGIATLHAPMAINFQNNGKQMFNQLNQVLTGYNIQLNIEPNKLNCNANNVSGTLIGGNLSVLYSILGSNSDPDTADCLLLIEDLDEYLYHVDRMMQALKRAGKFDKLKGLLVGGLTDMKDNPTPFGMTAEEIVRRAVEPYDFPVIFNVPSGHIENNQPLILGSTVSVSVNPNAITISQIIH